MFIIYARWLAWSISWARVSIRVSAVKSLLVLVSLNALVPVFINTLLGNALYSLAPSSSTLPDSILAITLSFRSLYFSDTFIVFSAATNSFTLEMLDFILASSCLNGIASSISCSSAISSLVTRFIFLYSIPSLGLYLDFSITFFTVIVVPNIFLISFIEYFVISST